MDEESKFRRNVTLVALAHVLVIGGGAWLGWQAEKPTPPVEKIAWLDQGALGGMSAPAPDVPAPRGQAASAPRPVANQEAPPLSPAPSLPPETKPPPAFVPKPDEFATFASSPSPTVTPTPTPRATPMQKATTLPTATATPTRKPTPAPAESRKPRPTPESAPKKKPTPTRTPTPKAKSKPSATPIPKLPKVAPPSKKPDDDAPSDDLPNPQPKKPPILADHLPAAEPSTAPKPAKKATAAGASSVKPDSPEEAAARAAAIAAAINAAAGEIRKPGQGGSAGTGPSGSGAGQSSGGEAAATELGWYNGLIKDRFYAQWEPPAVNDPASRTYRAALKITIEKDGRISHFALIKPSGIAAIDDSILVAAQGVKQIEPLPERLARRGSYEVAIAFEPQD